MKAIVVDDSGTMRRILKRMLIELGFEVSEAEDGVAALEWFKLNGAIDLALLDWNMPEMSGYDLLRMVRSKHEFDSMRIMMVTTESEMEKMSQALDAGADEYVMKPFTKDVITDKLSLLGFEGSVHGAAP
ncbi:MAG: response regulator [Polyangiaceae bacterium]|nr:response regulator [Polyangiaceae bacterium]